VAVAVGYEPRANGQRDSIKNQQLVADNQGRENDQGEVWVAKTPSRRKQTQSIDAKGDVREAGSDPAQKEWAADRGLPHVQKREEPTGKFRPAPAGAAKAVSLKLPGAGNDDGGHRPRATG
jgi:hypothetical protein